MCTTSLLLLLPPATVVLHVFIYFLFIGHKREQWVRELFLFIWLHVWVRRCNKRHRLSLTVASREQPLLHLRIRSPESRKVKVKKNERKVKASSRKENLFILFMFVFFILIFLICYGTFEQNYLINYSYLLHSFIFAYFCTIFCSFIKKESSFFKQINKKINCTFFYKIFIKFQKKNNNLKRIN